MSSDATELTVEQKRSFYDDGFIILRNAVSRDLTFEARRTINMYAGQKGVRRHYHDIATSDALPNLINKSSLSEIIRNTMGPYDPPQRAFAAILYPEPENELPNYSWSPHVDGMWYSSNIPTSRREVESLQAPRTEHFGDANAAAIGANMTPFFQDPACTLSLGSYTAFVGVALNDQTEFGRGNLCVLKGAHHEVEKFFQMQRHEGGPVGPEGPGWPRLIPVGNDGVSLIGMPHAIRDKFTEGAERTPGGGIWLKPTPVLLDEGDAVIALHACPHGASQNVGADPRMNVYFRLRHHRPGGATVMGDSDHPDRGWNGEFLEYPDDYDPWQVSMDAMCDHWSEWDGMQEVVAEARARGE